MGEGAGLKGAGKIVGEIANHTAARDSMDQHKASFGHRSLNYKALAIFAPILILVGIAGFLVPADKSLTSGAPSYNIFHLAFGVLGLVLLWVQQGRLASLFNAGFGLMDLYQALASYLGLPPQKYFLWTRVDDILHVFIGLALLIIGIYGLSRKDSWS